MRADEQRAVASCAEAMSAHPEAHFLSAEGGGRSEREAIAAAKAELASVISAQLSSELTVSTQQRGEGAEHQEMSQEVRVSSRFAHAELIKPLSECVRCSESSCEARVVLSRDEVAARMIEALGPDVERLTSALKQLSASAPLTDFTPAWYSAQGAHQRLLPALNQLEVIGRLPPQLININREMSQVRALRAARLQRVALWFAPLKVLSPEGQLLTRAELEPLKRALSERLSAAAEQVGARVWSEGRCPSQGEGVEVISLAPRGVLSCGLGLVGPQCRLELSVAVGVCTPPHVEPQALSAATWSDLKLAGVHTHDEAQALTRLTTTLTHQALTTHLARALSPVVPF